MSNKIKKKPASSISSIRNDEAISILNSNKDNVTSDTINALITSLLPGKVLIAASVDASGKPTPKLLKPNGSDDKFLGIYTDAKQIPGSMQGEPFLVLPFTVANKFAINPVDNIQGMVINPFTHNLVLKRPLLERIEDIEALKKNGTVNTTPGVGALSKLGEVSTDSAGKKVINMSEKQYNQFECTQFETGLLPRRFYEDPSSFITRLSSDKGSYIDELYEESYNQKRLYPYLPEDFSVMPLSITDDFTVITVDMPSKDLILGNAYRLYFTHDTSDNTARYFRIVCGTDQDKTFLEEIDKDHKITNHGDAPIEGTELSVITKMCGIEY